MVPRKNFKKMKLCIYPFLALTLSLLHHVSLTSAGTGILCDLTWTSHTSGAELPNNVVDSGNGDFVARAKIGAEWQPGRYSTVTNETIVGISGGEQTFKSYDLLTNPANCVISWVTKDGSPILNKFPVDSAQPNIFMGRGMYNELILGGRVENDRLFVGVDGTQIEVTGEFDILTSTFQLLQVKLSHFQFTVGSPADVEAKTVKRLFGIEEIDNQVSNTTIRQNVVHSDIFEDEFLISEPIKNWMGVGTVNLNLKLWYGSPIITDSFDVSDDQAVTAVLRRTREITMDREFEISSQSTVQICSISVLLRDYKITFTATMEINIDDGGLTESQIEHILEQTSRPVIENDGTLIKATFSGTLDGEYLLRTTSISGDVDDDGACSSKY